MLDEDRMQPHITMNEITSNNNIPKFCDEIPLYGFIKTPFYKLPLI
jgi:hypothetical protein